MPSDNYCHERNFWQHLSAEHGIALKTIARQRGLRQQKMNEADVLLTLYNAGLAERERNSVPELGASIDRRTMAHVSEVFGETKVKVLMCFSCACKEIACSGYDKFGYPVQKGKIAMRSNRKQLEKILGGEMRQLELLGRPICLRSASNLCMERLLRQTPACRKTVLSGFGK